MTTELIECVNVGLTPYFTSSPGIGKSAICADVAKRGKLKLIDLRLAQCTPEDLQGFPMREGNKAVFTPFSIFPLENDPIPQGYDGWMLLLDELSSANKQVQAAAYKLILDRQVGSFNLHPNCAIVAAGNKITDKAVVTQMSTALQSRLIHYELSVSVDDWIEWATKEDIDHRIIGYIHFSGKLMDFNPDHNDKTFACPRTWEFLNRLIKDKPINNSIGSRIAGTIGSGISVEFITFAQEYSKLPKFIDIIEKPDSVEVPKEASTKYAIVTMLINKAESDNLSKLLIYLKKFPIEMQIIFCRAIIIKAPELRNTNKQFSAYLFDMLDYLS